MKGYTLWQYLHLQHQWLAFVERWEVTSSLPTVLAHTSKHGAAAPIPEPKVRPITERNSYVSHRAGQASPKTSATLGTFTPPQPLKKKPTRLAKPTPRWPPSDYPVTGIGRGRKQISRGPFSSTPVMRLLSHRARRQFTARRVAIVGAHGVRPGFDPRAP